MILRKISAGYIFPVNEEPIKNGTIIVEQDGTIADIINTDGNIYESEGLEYYNGIICPGFINSFCRLEFSTLLKARQADLYMMKKGVVAIGDLSCNKYMEEIESNSKIYYKRISERFGYFNYGKSEAYKILSPDNELYKEITKPDFKINNEAGIKICIGTGNYVDSGSLSILDVLIKISDVTCNITIDYLIKWACINGAEALGIDSWAGSIEKGKRPGLNLITGINTAHMRFSLTTKVKKLI